MTDPPTDPAAAAFDAAVAAHAASLDDLFADPAVAACVSHLLTGRQLYGVAAGRLAEMLAGRHDDAAGFLREAVARALDEDGDDVIALGRLVDALRPAAGWLAGLARDRAAELAGRGWPTGLAGAATVAPGRPLVVAGPPPALADALARVTAAARAAGAAVVRLARPGTAADAEAGLVVVPFTEWAGRCGTPAGAARVLAAAAAGGFDRVDLVVCDRADAAVPPGYDGRHPARAAADGVDALAAAARRAGAAVAAGLAADDPFALAVDPAAALLRVRARVVPLPDPPAEAA